MTDKNRKLTKLVKNLTWVLSILFVVTFFIALFSIQGISNKINDNPSQYPEDWGMIGLGLIAMIIHIGIFQGIYIVLSIPTTILKKKTLRDGRTSIADVVFSILIAAISIPALFYGVVMAVNTFDLLSYGLGAGFLPYTIVILLHLATFVLTIVQLIKCWPKKPKAEVAEEVEELAAE